MAVLVQDTLFGYATDQWVRTQERPCPPPERAPERALHLHSLEAHADAEAELGARARAIRDWLRKFGPATDRQVKNALFGEGADMNMVRPRITDLINARQAHEVGEVVDEVTGRHVRRVRATMDGEVA
jgi:hypothetical protein